MALKLAGVRRHHLGLALAHADPEVRRTALRHPGCDGELLLGFLASPGVLAEQVRALSRPGVGSAHLAALWAAHQTSKKLMEPAPDMRELHLALATHPALDRDLWRQLWLSPDVDCRRTLLAHPAAAPDVLGEVALAELERPAGPVGAALAAEALRHPCCPHNILAAVLGSNRAELRLAAAGNPDLPGELVQDLLVQAQANPQVPDVGAAEREAALGGWNVGPQHLDLAQGDLHPAIRMAVLRSPLVTRRQLLRASVHADQDLAAEAVRRLGEAADQGNGLEKAELSSASNGGQATALRNHPPLPVSKAGRALVDHEPHYQMHPPQHQRFVENYRAVLAGQQPATSPDFDAVGGQSRKYVLGDVGGEPEGVRYLCKSYHEDDPDIVPHAGWAEMTNQALYHAAGIGHLHQEAHVANHNRKPRLVIRMLPGYRSAGRLIQLREDGRWHLPGTTEEQRVAARHINVMDFLTGNVDRNPGNIVVGPQGQLHAIDHARSFQYDFSDEPQQFAHAFLGDLPVTADIDPQDIGTPEGCRALSNAYRPVFDWWWGARHAVRQEFARHLPLIRDASRRDYLAGEFESRARWLDGMADGGLDHYGDMWWAQPVGLSKMEPVAYKAAA